MAFPDSIGMNRVRTNAFRADVVVVEEAKAVVVGVEVATTATTASPTTKLIRPMRSSRDTTTP